MEKWICKDCGYTQYGKAPDRCPQCGAPKSKFYQEGQSKGCLFSVISTIVMLTVVIFSFCACSSTLTVDNTAVSSVDLNRYLGQWYEVARFDHSFERDMEQCTATYTMREDGKIKVLNKGMKHGEWKTSEGKAKLTDHPGILRVSFFGPFYSDYRILMLAPDYSYALIGGNSDNYLWILSRTPQLEEIMRNRIIKEAQRRGYKTEKLIWVQQTRMQY